MAKYLILVVLLLQSAFVKADDNVDLKADVNIKITQTDSPDPIEPDSELSYTLTIENIGDNNVGFIEVEDTLPAGVAFISADGIDWKCSENNNKIKCDFQKGFLKPGDTTSDIVIKVKLPSDANNILTNIATVSSSGVETDSSDNTSTEETKIATEAEVNLKITQTDSPDPIEQGKELTYTLSIENIGKDDVKLIQVEDTLPKDVEFISASGCSEKDNKVVCDIQSVKAGETASDIIIKVKVSLNAKDSLTNTVTVSADGKEIDTATEETKVKIRAFELKTSVSPKNSGEIKTESDKDKVNLIAIPKSECYDFSHWEGACKDSLKECNLTLDSDKETVAHFKIKTVKLNATAENGQIDIQPQQAEYRCDDKVTLIPIADENYEFLVWSGDIFGKQNPLNLVLKQPKIDISAIFQKFSDLEIKPSNVQAVAKQKLKFTASGGAGNFFWAVTRGNIQASADGKTAIYTVPEETGSFDVWISDGINLTFASVNNDSGEKPIVFIRIIPNSLNLFVGDKQAITVKGYQADGKSKDLIANVNFSIENPDIIEINSNNAQIIAKAIGATKLIAKYQDFTAESSIQVQAQSSILQVEPNILSLEQGSSKTINISLVNQSGVKTIIDNATLTIDSNIASIEKYTITGTNKGVSSLKITVNDQSLSIPILVRSNPKLEITPHRASIVVNETTIFKVTGGKPPYQIQTDKGDLQQQSKNSYIFQSKVSGTAVLNVIDNAQNQVQATINIVAPLSVTPEKVVTASNKTVSLTASGGDGNYTWNMNQGKLDKQNGKTVNYNAPAKTGLYVVTVIDGLGNNKEVLVSVGEKLLLSQQQLFMKPEETTKLRVLGGIQPYSLNISAGKATLENGVINYTAPKVAGTHTLSVIDAKENQVSAEITVALDLLITPKSGRLDAEDKLTLHASGGFGKKRWVASKGELDKIEGQTVIWTTPKNFGPAFIHVIDAKGNKATASLEVSSSGFVITPSMRHVYPEDSANLTSIGGAAPYKWIVEAGDYVQKDDNITYTAPKVRGSYQVKVQDNSGKTAQAQ
ncbi:InlB B-repeat-containing protein, partial [Candidatus Marithrix sp. Canyon 246]